MVRILLALGIALVISSSGAQAQQAGIGRACAADIKQQCAGVARGGGRIVACLKEHLAELGDPCREALTAVPAMQRACKDDIQKSCAGVRQGGGRIIACLKEHAATVSEACKATVTRVGDENL